MSSDGNETGKVSAFAVGFGNWVCEQG